MRRCKKKTSFFGKLAIVLGGVVLLVLTCSISSLLAICAVVLIICGVSLVFKK
jgi:hypothetical protein